MKLTLNKPPSINHIYGYTSQGGFARSYITKEGKEWFAHAAIEIKKQSKLKKQISNPLEVFVTIHTHRDQDVDNLAKPILDALGGLCLHCMEKFTSRKPCKCGDRFSVLVNDKQVYKLDLEKTVDKSVPEDVVVELFGY